MRYINEQIILGHLGANPGMHHTLSNTVATVSVATSSKWNNSAGVLQERTEWHRVIVWGQTARYVGDFAKKGMLVFVQGETRHRTWEKQDGTTGYATEVHAREFIILTPGAHQMASGLDATESPVEAESPVESSMGTPGASAGEGIDADDVTF